ncbi:hypothetical protein [Pseudaestuariivita sp.]|uniref:hypothetical protein n=1 Tax=Pseudaestuariivita sp. TaxID=2211669 RepID=UPI004058C66D
MTRMFIVTHATLRNPGVLETRSLPKRFLGRVAVIPRAGAGTATWARLIFEVQVLRYIVALLPFVIAMLIWPQLALPLAQAPLAMILVIALVEMKALHYSDTAREKLIDEDAAARVLDQLTYRARGMLPEIAARHEMSQGQLHLVLEQSEIARVAPLTLVSIQAEDPNRVLSLTPEDRQALAVLFDTDLTERDLHRANARAKTYLRDITYDVRGVSAHARLGARLQAKGKAQAKAHATATEATA